MYALFIINIIKKTKLMFIFYPYYFIFKWYKTTIESFM